MYTEEYIARRLREIRKDLDLTQRQFADMLGVSLASLQRYEAGHPPGRKALRTITRVIAAADEAEGLGGPPEESLSTMALRAAVEHALKVGEVESESEAHHEASSGTYTPLPLVKPRLAAGGGSVVIDEDVETWLHFRTEWLKQIGPARQLVLMRIEGDSMEPTLYENDVVMIHQGKQELRPGQ